MLTRRTMLSGAGAAGMAATAGSVAAVPAATARGPLLDSVDGSVSSKLFLPPDDLQPATETRLPLSWSKERMARLQAILARNRYDGVLLTNRFNIIYFTGLWHTTTERLLQCFIPAKGDPIWFYPALDRDLVQSWWYSDGDMYFDYPDVAGGMPQEGQLARGPARDLTRWVLEGLKRRGYAGKSLATDRETSAAQAAVSEVIGRPMPSLAGELLAMRMRKTPLELALTRRACSYFDRMHAYARDLILTHGTDLTDYEVGRAAQQYGTELMMADLKPTGLPHDTVGMYIGLVCRTGKPTGYPHPNQFYYTKIQRGQTLQMAGAISISGCGNECYRSYLLGPRTPHMERLWTVTRDSCLLMKDLLRKGTEAAEVAYKIHEYQIRQGVQQYIYHRPGHGQGMEGHQAPFIALGDHTPLDTGMMFSVEPGLYDSAQGIGINFSDGFVVQDSGPARQISRLPWTEQWSWLDI